MFFGIKIIVASEASDPILKTISSHTQRASFASVIFPVKWGGGSEFWEQPFGGSRLGAAKRSTLFVSHFFAFQPISMKFGMGTGYDVMCFCV